MLVRSDSAGANHALADACRETGCRFSFGYSIDERVRAAILGLAKRAWKPAINAGGERREGAWVAELTGLVSLAGWPQGTRLICRRERPRPGAPLSFTDVDGHRFQCFISDQQGRDIARLERRHREHAGVEGVIQALKETGLRNLPFRDFEPNEAWLELVLTAHQLIVYSESLLFDGEHARYEPKRLCATGCCTSPASSPARGAG
ncbi:MAG: transposase [Thermoleophilaceae bacterium]